MLVYLLSSSQPKFLSGADVIVDHASGLLLRPLSLLLSDAGWRGMANVVTALSLQLRTCWVVLYAQSQNTYVHRPLWCRDNAPNRMVEPLYSEAAFRIEGMSTVNELKTPSIVHYYNVCFFRNKAACRI